MRKHRLICVAVLLFCVARVSAGTYPRFAARQDFTSLSTYYVAIGDTNGDGYPDLIANAHGTITILLGNGKGGFKIGPSQTTVSGFSTNFLVLDLNGDGKLDLLFSAEVGTIGIAVCLGHGDGTFDSGTFYTAGSDGTFVGTGLATGDFNGDGKTDAVLAGASGIWLFAGKGDGTFQAGVVAAPLEYGTYQLASADFNQDGKMDVVVGMSYAGTGDGSRVLFGNGDGSFQSPLRLDKPVTPFSVLAGPLTAGGPPAIVLTSANDDYVFIYQSDGAGGVSGPRYAYLPGHVGIALGDVNNDGLTDLVSPFGDIAFGEPGGKFRKPVSYPVQSFGGQQLNVALGDLRHSGMLDIVAGGYYAISVLLNLGGGKFLDGNWIAAPSGYCGVSGDFNRDGNDDVAIANASGISLLLGTGSKRQTFQAGAVLPLANAGCPVARDVNGDGIVDLVVHSPSGVAVFLGTGLGTFTQKSLTPTPIDGQLALADFNQDGKLDFATSGNLLALGNGDGTFQTPKAFVLNPPSSGFTALDAGDINNDGWPDVVLGSGVQPFTNVYVMLNDQHGGFTQVPASFGQAANQIILSDLNRDGKSDMVLLPGEGGVLVYLGDGQGHFKAAPSLSVPLGITGYNINLVADLNGDGIVDIAAKNGNTISVYTGKGDGTFASPVRYGGGPNSTSLILANLHGQTPSAGKPDLVLPDLSGLVTVLFNFTE